MARFDNPLDPYIIAEIGVNHQGSIDLAKELIVEAKSYGFSSVKLQHIIPRKIWHTSVFEDLALSENESLPNEWLDELTSFAHRNLIEIGCTPTFQGSASIIKNAGCDFIKVASPQSQYDCFILQETIDTGLPLVISNGYCSFRESLDLIDFLSARSSTQPIAFLFCIAQYPSDSIGVCNEQIEILSSACNQNSMAFGISDHNLSMYQALLLRHVYGATVFEKHFSSPNCTSLDRDVSIHSWQAREYVRQLRLSAQVQSSMRDDCISDKTHIFASSFYLDRDVKAGDTFVLSHCRRLRDGKVDSMNTKSFWSSYRSNYNYHYSRDLPRGARLEEGDLV